MRTNLFLKVVVEHDAEHNAEHDAGHDKQESPEKLAAELCRQLERSYMVRSAELTHYSAAEE